MSYLAIYILISLLSPQNFIAIIPLVMYVSGFVCSMAMKPVSKLIGISVSLYLIRYWQQQPLVLWFHVFCVINKERSMVMRSVCLLSDYVFDRPAVGAWFCHLGVFGQQHGSWEHLWSSGAAGSRFSYYPGHVSVHDGNTHRGADGRWRNKPTTVYSFVGELLHLRMNRRKLVILYIFLVINDPSYKNEVILSKNCFLCIKGLIRLCHKVSV